MKQRFRNIFDLKTKKHGTSVVIVVLVAVLVSSVLVSCQANTNNGTDNSPSASVSPSSTDVSSITDPPPVTSTPGDATNIKEVAISWAEAVKNRDGKAQYALMTTALQAKMHDEFANLNWVTGTSSPWVVSYVVEEKDGAVRVTFDFATSTGPAGKYAQDLTFKEESNSIKIDSISELQEVTSAPASPSGASLSFKALIGLIGMTKDELLKAVPETSVPVDEGGLGFDKTGIRVWFDTETYTKVAQVLIMTSNIDIDGLKLGDSYKDFKDKFGEPISDTNGDAHFKYGDIYLSVVRDTSTDKTIAVYILAEDF